MLNGRQQFGMAVAAAIAGVMWGYARHRDDRRAMWFALIQGAEWFVANGGAMIALRAARELLDRVDAPEIDDFEVERITRTRQVVSERTGTDG